MSRAAVAQPISQRSKFNEASGVKSPNPVSDAGINQVLSQYNINSRSKSGAGFSVNSFNQKRNTTATTRVGILIGNKQNKGVISGETNDHS